MTGSHVDVAVVGLGAHGSAVAAHAAAAGLSVLGIEAGTSPHRAASHHGESRAIRAAYYEHPSYVPLMRRAYVLWDALQAGAGEPLLQRTGGLMIGPPDGELVPGALQSAREHGLAHERLTRSALARRFPDFRVSDGLDAVFEPDAGVLRPEACVRAHLAMARRHGATILMGRTARFGEAHSGRRTLLLSDEVVDAAQVVVTAGPGLVGLGLPLSRDIVIERQVVAHFLASAGRLAALPVFAVEEPDGRFFYGFPDLGSGVKVAEHHGGTTSRDGCIDDTVRNADIDVLRTFLRRRLPAADGRVGNVAVCRYTNTTDGHFVFDRREPGLTVVSACSGHGFKFAPVIGEIAARWLCAEDVPFDLTRFVSGRVSRP